LYSAICAFGVSQAGRFLRHFLELGMKDLMDRNGVLDQRYNFEAKAEEEALRMWCSLNSIELSD